MAAARRMTVIFPLVSDERYITSVRLLISDLISLYLSPIAYQEVLIKVIWCFNDDMRRTVHARV